MKIQKIAPLVLLITIALGGAGETNADSPADTVKASLKNYFAAWREPDAQKRQALLQTAWAENGTYTDPTAHVDGRDALVKHIEGFLSNAQTRSFKLDQSSGFDIHHRVFRFQWEMKDPSGNTLVGGMDYGEFNEDGAITKIVGFFGPFPAMK